MSIMTTLYLRFFIHLKDHNLRWGPAGPLFHRWLPNKENDYIELPIENSKINLKVWFEQRGYLNGFIRHHNDPIYINPELIPKQAVLTGGGLFGSVEVDDVSDDDLIPLRENLIGDERYEKLGKQIIKIIQPPLSNFIEILHKRYCRKFRRTAHDSSPSTH